MPDLLQAVRGNVGEVINEKDQRGQRAQLLKDLDLEQVGRPLCSSMLAVGAAHPCGLPAEPP